jgi:voltage-gated potassium channel
MMTHHHESLVERRANKIANARSVTFGLALTFLGLACLGAVFMRFADSEHFPTFGSAVWWALQTITTVGYGDAVPTSSWGKVVAGVEMVIGVSFIAFLTATVTSTVVQRSAGDQQDEVIAAISALNERLDRIESKLPNG